MFITEIIVGSFLVCSTVFSRKWTVCLNKLFEIPVRLVFEMEILLTEGQRQHGHVFCHMDDRVDSRCWMETKPMERKRKRKNSSRQEKKDASRKYNTKLGSEQCYSLFHLSFRAALPNPLVGRDQTTLSQGSPNTITNHRYLHYGSQQRKITVMK